MNIQITLDVDRNDARYFVMLYDLLNPAWNEKNKQWWYGPDTAESVGLFLDKLADQMEDIETCACLDKPAFSGASGILQLFARNRGQFHDDLKRLAEG